MPRPLEVRRAALCFVLAASLLVCLIQVVKNTRAMPQDDGSTEALPSSDYDALHVSSATFPPLEGAVLSLGAMERSLLQVQSNLERMERLFVTSVLPALLHIQRQLKYIGVSEYERARVKKIVQTCAEQVDGYCAALKDELQSLITDVQFVISDMTSNVDHVVPSSFSSMRTLMRSFDMSFTKNKAAAQRAASHVRTALLRAVAAPRYDARASEIRDTLLVLTGDLKSELDDVTKAKLKYDVIKGNAARDLNLFITSY